MAQPRTLRDTPALIIAALALVATGCQCVHTKAADFATKLGSNSAARALFTTARNIVGDDSETACRSSRGAGKHSAAGTSCKRSGGADASARALGRVAAASPDAYAQTVVVRARVDADRQIVAVEDRHSFLDTRVAVLARHLSPTMPSGTEITAIFGIDRGQRTTSSKQLLALQVGTGVGAVRAFYVRDVAHRVDGFYTVHGRPVEEAFLRFPVNYMFISSPFSRRRTHPILKSRRPHLGVDLAAPRGTPVVAVADGKIIEATWSGAYGRTVYIRHDQDYVTGYAHLERFAPDIVAGVTVRKGQIIGFVGASGLATGPHLHFSMLKDGSFVDPLATRLPPARRLRPLALARLQASAARMTQTFVAAEPERAEPTRIASRSRGN